MMRLKSESYMNLLSLHAEHAITVFMAFFAVMNPLAVTAVFSGLTAHADVHEKRRVALRALLIAFIIILSFSLLGKMIFHLFGITLPALRITGGLLLFVVGYQMLHGTSSKLQTAEKSDGADIALSPLAVPILAGPGTISTAINYSAAGGWFEVVATIMAFFLLCMVTFFCFIFSAKILSLIGVNGLRMTTSLMGLIISVVGVQMIIVGVKGAIALPF